jgi:outer membrane lipoprotein-sorting protein
MISDLTMMPLPNNRPELHENDKSQPSALVCLLSCKEILAIIGLFIIYAGTCFSQSNLTPMKDIAGFKEKLVNMTAKITTIESDFVQEKNLSILSNKIISKGSFCFQKENNIRWEYLQPYKYLIIISNDQMYIKEDRNEKRYDIQSNKMFQEMNKFISGCIQGDILKNEKEYNSSYFENPGSYVVSLVPKAAAMKEMLQEVRIWFNRNDFTVTRIIMAEPGGDYTAIDFMNKKLNVAIPAEKFSFK